MFARHLLEQLARGKPGFAAGGKIVHFGYDRFDSEAIGVAERSTTERRKTGAHDHAEIHILGRSDDPFLEATSGFVDHQVNHPIPKGFAVEVSRIFTELKFVGLHVDDWLFAFGSMEIEAAASFLSDEFRLEHAGQHRRSGHAAGIFLSKVVSNMLGDIDTDLVDEAKRAHGHTEI